MEVSDLTLDDLVGAEPINVPAPSATPKGMGGVAPTLPASPALSMRPPAPPPNQPGIAPAQPPTPYPTPYPGTTPHQPGSLGVSDLTLADLAGARPMPVSRQPRATGVSDIRRSDLVGAVPIGLPTDVGMDGVSPASSTIADFASSDIQRQEQEQGRRLSPQERVAVTESVRSDVLGGQSLPGMGDTAAQIRDKTIAGNTAAQNASAAFGRSVGSIAPSLAGLFAPEFGADWSEAMANATPHDPETKSAFAGGVVGGAGKVGATLLAPAAAVPLFVGEAAGSKRIEVARRRQAGQEISGTQEAAYVGATALINYIAQRIGMKIAGGFGQGVVNSIQSRSFGPIIQAATKGIFASGAKGAGEQFAYNVADRLSGVDPNQPIDENIIRAATMSALQDTIAGGLHGFGQWWSVRGRGRGGLGPADPRFAPGGEGGAGPSPRDPGPRGPAGRNGGLGSLDEAAATIGIDLRSNPYLDDIERAVRQSYFRTHPDRGGNPADFQRVTAAADMLKQAFANRVRPGSQRPQPKQAQQPQARPQQQSVRPSQPVQPQPTPDPAAPQAPAQRPGMVVDPAPEPPVSRPPMPAAPPARPTVVSDLTRADLAGARPINPPPSAPQPSQVSDLSKADLAGAVPIQPTPSLVQSSSPTRRQTTPRKEPWQMTTREFNAYERKLAPHEIHFTPASDSPTGKALYGRESAIASAIRDGHTVPPEILADYPHLAQLSPQAQDAPAEAQNPRQAFSMAQTGRPFSASLMRGQGRSTSPYNEGGPQEPILGAGQWTTPDEAYARHFGDNITRHTVKLDNPLVIRTDDEWRSLTRAAGWRFPNPFGGDPATASSDIARLRAQLESQGYDGVIIDPSERGDEGKTLWDVFGAQQVVEFRPQQQRTPTRPGPMTDAELESATTARSTQPRPAVQPDEPLITPEERDALMGDLSFEGDQSAPRGLGGPKTSVTPISESPGPTGRDVPAHRDYGTLDAPNRDSIGQHFADQFGTGKRYPSINEARTEASRLLGGDVKPGTLAAKHVDEAVEIGVTRAAREIVSQGKDDVAGTMQKLVDLYERQPNLAVRTSTSMAQQAYSTPAPLAYAAQILAGIGPQTRVYEPTAGNGMLLTSATPGNVTANELNTERAEALRAQGFAVSNEDAAQWTPRAGSHDVVIANPPFGAVRDDGGQRRTWTIDGVTTGEIDHAISLQALEAMADNGRAVLILGTKGHDARTDLEKRKAYLNRSIRPFYQHLYQQYGVAQHFTVSGDLYARQGAGFPVDVIVIDGRGRASRKYPWAEVPKTLGSWQELYDVIAASRPTRPQRPAGAEMAPRVESAGKPAVRRDDDPTSAGRSGTDVAAVSPAPDRQGELDGGRVRRPAGSGEGGGTVVVGPTRQPAPRPNCLCRMVALYRRRPITKRCL